MTAKTFMIEHEYVDTAPSSVFEQYPDAVCFEARRISASTSVKQQAA